MVLNGAACCRADQPVMSSDMPGNTADRSALEAAFGASQRREASDGQTEYKGDEKFAHMSPCESVGLRNDES